ncbi:mycofactocin system transcriptional regulator [Nocardia donostiensis]|uniref:Mycofactocin system transcriptional regulator n=1 Tax=Nocardia donostiensis TaxID=1538463 RepID=A0A1W0B007_9NOCA|nr:mycofactocin system transcriptional regulator [Nocardia donostiensis]ONM50196.1 mycofactocin system transcriptional regulator [Nocardia donostiensis]OQS15857.1 mycofactocin system transcriptional regulator [Nocardia donostiensis]OQS23664.1 mycofactocin system transcriptional regulator [Nocardia donostiensis]
MTAHSTRGRPRGTTKRELELIAMRLFSEQGFDETTVEQIAAAAGISGRTFFRYFPGKAEVLWYSFDDEVAALRADFATVGDTEPLMAAVRRVVVNANRYRAEDVPELRTRMRLVATVPALAATAGAHYDAWEQAVSEFAATRLDTTADDLIPMAIGRCALAAARAAFDAWLTRADADLTVYLDQALAALERGFTSTPPTPRSCR